MGAMDLKQPGFAALLIGLVAATLWMTADPVGTVRGKDPVETTTKPHLIRQQEEVDGTLVITHKPSGDRFVADVLDRQLFQSPEQRDADTWETKLQRERYLVDPGLDIGAFVGPSLGAEGRDDGEIPATFGVRVSGVRLLYGMLSPDALVTQDSYGVGLTAFPPPDRFGRLWSNLGVGVGRLWRFDGTGDETVVYLGTSTRF